MEVSNRLLLTRNTIQPNTQSLRRSQDLLMQMSILGPGRSPALAKAELKGAWYPQQISITYIRLK